MTYNKVLLVIEQYLYSIYTLLLVVVGSYLFDLATVGWLTLVVLLCTSWYSIFEQSFFYQYLKNIKNVFEADNCDILNTQALIFITVGICFFIPLFSIFLPDDAHLINSNVYLYFFSSIFFEHIRKIQIAQDHVIQVMVRSTLRIFPLIVVVISFRLGLPITIGMLIVILSICNITLSILFLPARLRKVSLDISAIKRSTKNKILACRYLSASVIVDSIVNLTINIFFTHINGLPWIAVFRIYQSIFGIINPVIQFVFLEYFKSNKLEGTNNTRSLIYFSSVTFVALFFTFDHLLLHVFSDQAKFDHYFFAVFVIVYFILIGVNNLQYQVINETDGAIMFISSVANLTIIVGFFVVDKFWAFNSSNNWILLWASLSLVKMIVLSSRKIGLVK